jgi:predicted cation transporter
LFLLPHCYCSERDYRRLLIATFAPLTPPVLFWANIVPAILDNATLAAAETGPALSSSQLTAVLLGLLVSGGMLIPGNVPNIVAANHLGIGSREWARFAVPVGLVLMVIYFAAWMLFSPPSVLTIESAAKGLMSATAHM